MNRRTAFGQRTQSPGHRLMPEEMAIECTRPSIFSWVSRLGASGSPVRESGSDYESGYDRAAEPEAVAAVPVKEGHHHVIPGLGF
ncbi:MAG: hypothetical protein MRY63_00320 [Neomegalonema sp.]|nr:hypothetical protein [Neomegalonema sp.]